MMISEDNKSFLLPSLFHCFVWLKKFNIGTSLTRTGHQLMSFLPPPARGLGTKTFDLHADVHGPLPAAAVGGPVWCLWSMLLLQPYWCSCCQGLGWCLWSELFPGSMLICEASGPDRRTDKVEWAQTQGISETWDQQELNPTLPISVPVLELVTMTLHWENPEKSLK